MFRFDVERFWSYIGRCRNKVFSHQVMLLMELGSFSSCVRAQYYDRLVSSVARPWHIITK